MFSKIFLFYLLVKACVKVGENGFYSDVICGSLWTSDLNMFTFLFATPLSNLLNLSMITEIYKKFVMCKCVKLLIEI